MQYKRILLKLSGESLGGSTSCGLDPERLKSYAEEIEGVAGSGCQLAIVMGGGNIFRGLASEGRGFDRVQGDYMGMMATVINCMAMESTLRAMGIEVCHLSAFGIDPLCEKTSATRAIRALDEGKVVLFSGGTGNPYFTTDSAAVLRAVEIKADILLKGTRVDGIFDADPEKDHHAKLYESISFKEAYEKKLKIMDLTAFTLCEENRMPLLVFNMHSKGNLKRIVEGHKTGTLVHI
ncbi:MAG TPA: UMP kinase [Bacteroidales bacterium]|nr:UMP kinase [Bacteroidales bacterium]HSA43400.1 UMP kinase [Bacteroidales bacterium]